MYQDLQEMEKKLDWTIMRKKAEVQDALGRSASVSTDIIPSLAMLDSYHAQTTRTLRLFLSHTSSGQSWQSETPQSGTAEAPNFETGQGIPAWQLKVEGRLLEVSRDFCCLVSLLRASHVAPKSASEGQDSSTTVLHTNKEYGN